MVDDGTPTAFLTPRHEWFSLASPIGVIGAFASLVELALILGVIFAEGSIRWAMLVLAAVFFAATVGPFFYILIRMNWVLYPPKDYGGETGVSTYVEAMSLQWIERKAKSDTAAQAVIGVDPVEDSVQVFLGPRTANSLGLHLSYDSNMTIRDFITHVSAMLHRMGTTGSSFDDLTHYLNYGTSWVLRESGTEYVFHNIGPVWSWKETKNLSDLRRIPDTDLKPGMNLEIDRLMSCLLPVAQLPFVDDSSLHPSPTSQPSTIEGGPD